MVKHLIPANLGEALKALADNEYRIVSGGTDVMVQKRAGTGVLPTFDKDALYVFNLTELKYVTADESFVHIGSETALEDVLNHPLTPKLLSKVISEIAAPGIRHMATLAGNIANASPAGDSLVALYALDAIVELQSVRGTRNISINDLIVGVRKTTLDRDELITRISIPKQEFDHVVWTKVGGRQADAISKVSFAGCYRIENGRLADIRIAMGAIAPTVIRSQSIEKQMIGKTIGEIKAVLPMILDFYLPFIRPIDDQRSSAEYRHNVAVNLLTTFIENIG